MANFLVWAGTALEIVLLWRLIAWRAWRHVPWFFFFFLFLFLRLQTLTYAYFAGYDSTLGYAHWYWRTSVIAMLLWFPVAWEVVRCLFGPHPRVFQVVAVLILALSLTLSALFLLGKGPGEPGIPDIERKIALVIALLLFLTLLLARYYQVTPGLNIWGIALGLGLFAAATLVNFAAWGIDEHFFPVFRYVRPVSFVLTLLIWTWTLWVHTPNSGTLAGPLSDIYLTQQQSLWSKIQETVRRALGS